MIDRNCIKIGSEYEKGGALPPFVLSMKTISLFSLTLFLRWIKTSSRYHSCHNVPLSPQPSLTVLLQALKSHPSRLRQ